MALREEGIECFTESIVVEFLSGDVPQEFGARFFSPLGDVDKPERAKHPGGDEDREDSSIIEFGLAIGGEMLVDDLGDIHALKERSDDGECADVASFDVCVGLVSIPRCSVHLRSVANLRKAS